MGEQNKFRGEYLGGHAARASKCNVIFTLLPTEIFIEHELEQTKLVDGGFQHSINIVPMLHIPYNAIKEVKNVTKDSIDALRVIALGVVGALWKKEETYLCIVYNDGIQEQTLIFGSEKMDVLQREIYQRLDKVSRLKKEEETSKEESVNPLLLLQLRYVKGEITKEQYEEMKKVLQS